MAVGYEHLGLAGTCEIWCWMGKLSREKPGVCLAGAKLGLKLWAVALPENFMGTHTAGVSLVGSLPGLTGPSWLNGVELISPEHSLVFGKWLGFLGGQSPSI